MLPILGTMNSRGLLLPTLGTRNSTDLLSPLLDTTYVCPCLHPWTGISLSRGVYSTCPWARLCLRYSIPACGGGGGEGGPAMQLSLQLSSSSPYHQSCMTSMAGGIGLVSVPVASTNLRQLEPIPPFKECMKPPEWRPQVPLSPIKGFLKNHSLEGPQMIQCIWPLIKGFFTSHPPEERRPS